MIEHLAELCHFSPTHFMNFFKKTIRALLYGVHHSISVEKKRPISSSIPIRQSLISQANLASTTSQTLIASSRNTIRSRQANTEKLVFN